MQTPVYFVRSQLLIAQRSEVGSVGLHIQHKFAHQGVVLAHILSHNTLLNGLCEDGRLISMRIAIDFTKSSA